jgi:ferric-dicitrate binding protein FerR (iron transport regulator)
MKGELAMTEKRFEELLACYLNGEATQEQIAELHQAVFSSDEHRTRFQTDSRLNVLMREVLAEEVEIQAFAQTTVQTPRIGPSGRSLRRWTAAAAMIAIAAAILTGLWLHGDRQETALGTCLNVSDSGKVEIQRGDERFEALDESALQAGDRVICDAQGRAMLRLSDGSILSMEPGSKLALISDRPQVELEQGEVLFEIAARDEGAEAFEVRTGQSTVAVMGTVFTLEADDQTKLKVYEGRVTFTRHSDKASVEVGSQQMTASGIEQLTVRKMATPAAPQPAEVVNILPTDDVTLDRGARSPGPHLKVEGKRRTAYLRYVIPTVGTVISAKLRMTQTIDPGKGTLRFFLGQSSDWDENTLTKDAAPPRGREVARRTGVVQRHQVIEVDVSDAVRKPGPITLIITLDKMKENDIWFGSKESSTPPRIILTHRPGPDQPR